MDIIQTKDYFEAHEHNLHEIFYSTKNLLYLIIKENMLGL